MNFRSSHSNQYQRFITKLPTKFFPNLIPEIINKTGKQSKAEKIEDFVEIFQDYFKYLLGIEKNEEELLHSENNIASFDDCLSQFDEPEVVVSLPNPDYISEEPQLQQKQYEIVDQIVQALVLEQKSIQDKLFLKAIEIAFIQLSDRKTYSLFEQRTRGLETIPNDQRNAMNLLGTNQQIFDQSNQFCGFIENNNNNRNSQDFGLCQREIQIKKAVNQFRQDLLELASQNKWNIQMTAQQIQIDFQKIQQQQQKAYSQGEYLRLIQSQWNKTMNETSDLLTLVRNILIVQFSRKGFMVRSIISEDGSKIYLLLYMPEQMLEIAAENCQLSKKLCFCFSDLFSLEPVDKQLRPLRLNGRLWKPDEYSISSYLQYLRPLIIDQIMQINFKRLARDVGQSNINNELFEYGKINFYGDQEGPTDDEWTAYYIYLVHLNKQIEIQRKKYFIESDIALILDKQKSAEELFALRTGQKPKGYFEFTEEEQEQIQILFEKIRELQGQQNKIQLSQKLPILKKIKLFKQQQLASNYYLIFQEALKVANSTGQTLKTIWDRYYQQPFELYIPFTLRQHSQSIKNIAKSQLKWSRYLSKENHQITLFPTNERLKLAYFVLSTTIRLDIFINMKLINSVFSLHNNYELFGISNNHQQEINSEFYMYEQQPFDLSGKWNLNYLYPWSMPISKICIYFGEKIGLYFKFSSYYIQFSTIMAALGVIFNMIMYSTNIQHNDISLVAQSIFSILIINLNCFLTDYWNQTQFAFNIQNGQNNNYKYNLIRSSFKGEQIRSISTDQLNFTGIIHFQFFWRISISIFVLILIFGSDVCITIGLYFFNLYLESIFASTSIQFRNFEIIVTAILNYVIQIIVEYYYESIAIVLTDFENFQTVEHYENSYCLKKYALICFSQLFPLLILCFLNGELNLKCSQNNCIGQAQYFFGTTLLLTIINVKRRIQQIKEKSYSSKNLLTFIENQESKTPFQQTQEKYGIIDEYMKFFLLSTLINMFGGLFPLSFTLFWIWMILQFQIVKFKLLYQIQRPWPKGDSSLGIWFEIHQFINFISLLSNCSLICVYYYKYLQDDVIQLFVTLLFYNFFIKYITNTTFLSPPLILEYIVKRGQYIYQNNIKILTNRSSRREQENKVLLQRCPLYKVFGSNGMQRADYFETISSDDEILDHQRKKIQLISQRLVEQETNYLISKAEIIQNEDHVKQTQSPINSNSSKISNSSPLNSVSSPIFTVSSSRQNNRMKSIIDPFESTTQIQNSAKEIQKLGKSKFQLMITEIIKKLQQVDKLDYQFFYNYYKKRSINWAFQIQSCQSGPKQLIRDRTIIWRFFFRLQLLSSYNMLWNDYRLVQSQSYFRRKQKALHNLDYKRFQILKQSFENQNKYYKAQAALKFSKQFRQFGNQLTLEERKEYNELVLKYNKFIEKKSWLNCRKVTIFRYKGLFFRGFRKQSIRKQAIQFVLEYYEATKKLEEAQNGSDIHKKFNNLVQYTQLNQYTLELFIELFNKLEYEQKTSYIFPSVNGRIQQKNYYLNSLKSEVFKNIIDKSKDTYIFEQYSTKLEEFVLQYCLDEMNQIPNITMKKHLHDLLWIVEVEDQEYLMQFFQIKHGQQLQFLKHYNNGLGVFVSESKNYIKLLNIIDQIDDFLIKAYCVSLYPCLDCKTLYQVIKFRKKHSLHYTIDQLMQFLYANLIILSKGIVNSLSIYTYALSNNEYMILNSILQEDNPVFQLVQVILEMILLDPIEDLGEVLKNIEHPLLSFLMDILYNDLTASQALENMQKQDPFSDINFQFNLNLKDQSYQFYIENMKHQINFHLRMKQFKKSIQLIQEAEDYLAAQHNVQTINFMEKFLDYISREIQTYILKPHDIKKILDTLLIFYFKISALFGLKQQIEPENSQIIAAIKKCCSQLKIILKQLSFNIKLENLSEVEHRTILKQKFKQTQDNQSSVSSFERLNLISTLRKNSKYILILIQFHTQIQRYKNQFTLIKAIYNYFNKNFILADLQYIQIIQREEELAFREPIPTFLNVPLDHTPGLINLKQSSPLDEDNDDIGNEEYQTKSKGIIDRNTLYCTQLTYFKYLHLINLYDNRNEEFSKYYQQFKQIEGAYIPVYNFYLNQLKLLNKEEIQQQDQEYEEQCDVGKYLIIKFKKWKEITSHQQVDLLESDDLELLKFQIMIFSNLQTTFKNRKILQHSMQLFTFSKICCYNLLFRIKLIQFILHLDNVQPVNHNLSTQIQRTTFCHQNQQSFIQLLKQIHQQIQLQQDSWFFHSSLEELQVFYYLSICFAYSPKHLENLVLEENEISKHATNQIKKFQFKSKFYCQTLKCTQINNRKGYQLQFDSNLGKQQQQQLFCQFLNCSLKQYHNLRGSYQQISECLNDDIESSIFVLALIHNYLQLQQFDLVDLMTQFSLRLIQCEAPIFDKKHQGFEQDLYVVESLYKSNHNCIPYPQKYLFEYTDTFYNFEDIKFYAQYILFNIMMNQNYFLIQEIVTKLINTLKGNAIYCRFIHIFEYQLDAIQAMIGKIDPKKQRNYQDQEKIESDLNLNNYLERTLIYAILALLQCKYHLNLFDYENALKYSEKVLKYVVTFLKQEQTILSIINRRLIQEYPVHTFFKDLKIMEYEFLIDEIVDSDYIHIFNKDFINEAILNHIRILINLGKNVPKVNILFSLQLSQIHKTHQPYLQMIYAMYFNFLLKEKDNKLIEHLLVDEQNQIGQIRKKIKDEEMKYNAYSSLKLYTESDAGFIHQNLIFLDFQLNVLSNSKNKVNKKLINNWILSSTQKAINGYQNIQQTFSYLVHPHISIIYLIQYESYTFLNQMQKAQDMLDLTNESLSGWYEDNKHPIKGIFLYHLGIHDRWLYSQYIRCLKIIISLNRFDIDEITRIAQGLIYQEKQLIAILDSNTQNRTFQIGDLINEYLTQRTGKKQLQISEISKNNFDSQSILDDVLEKSSLKTLNGIQKFFEALAIFYQIGTEHNCKDLIKRLIVESN
ncbi:unnamed protein product (macronuclear) [Paramecium tetraurelia]|uniref:Anoctamin transmembrane domain-containing protein n=1 Tax=Paramecium tetraurelia TaxID=5888 RepID=A0C5J6_PARTE|nr:uncharacterized protein GSPATT00006562001 [Paramecium tetraurelia]CAK66063.1 unnamed protein product [Paramecium tetraurelia]|eukprot:XP_001433460.1 hypothetical protein (macronuclear) [Paramecium tetraurelia strain d4-2]